MLTLAKIKLKLGISHNLKDDAIKDDMDTARLEMIRAGCNPDVVNSGEYKLVEKAVETYVMMEYMDPSLRDQYQAAFDLQVNNIRKSTGYMEEDDSDV